MIIEDKRILVGVAGAIILAAGSGYLVARWTADAPAATGEADEATEAPLGGALVLTADQVRDAGIMVEAIRPGGFDTEMIAQGMVAPTPSGEALVTARTGGTVTRVFKRLGDPVRAGEALAIVESRDAAQIASERSAAGARVTLAQRNLAREKYLFDQKVSARVELERAEAEAAVAQAEARRADASASAVRITSNGRGSSVVSPISGRVTATTIALGAFVQPEAELFRVSDPRQIQVEASIGPADMGRLAAGDRAVVELPDGATIEGRVRSVTPALGSETRAATAVIDIAGGKLQPGLGVRVRLYPGVASSGSAIVVPQDAVQSLEGRSIVFVRTSQGFRAQTVTIGTSSAGRVEILAGLKPGQLVATRNAFVLKAELGKGAGEEE
ncbi:MAG: efflux RND transporter periplasmic adaptor subunit [Candidatus Andeanibacterium colombiense]|uniref:Efflux RND transporter periplasmic adaptor subunit n=1 Tax=Candidatus Andeanibacterium colombiense TaxID=3121345 RepID=A0AAJ5X5S3_9SPHN|nr:MAG: efflux RND transporter periplasmic adaptor subunit [Sphingomonadaceae bacterium]